MQKFMIVLVVVLLAAVLSPELLPAEEVYVNICMRPDRNDAERAWTDSIFSALSRLVHMYDLEHGFGVRFLAMEECGELANEACYGRGSSVYLDAEKFAHILLGEAFLAAAYVVPMALHPDSPGIVLLTPLEAYRFADTMFKGGQEELAETIRTVTLDGSPTMEEMTRILLTVYSLHRYDNDPSLPPESVMPEVILTYGLYESVTNYVFAFILGHELSHAHGECFAAGESLIEKDGLFQKMVDIQSQAEVFCPNPLLGDEVKADRCGYRMLGIMDDLMVEAKSSIEDKEGLLAMLSVGRRQAIDCMGWFFYTGMTRRMEDKAMVQYPQGAGSPVIAYVEHLPRGYLFPALRHILFAELLRKKATVRRDLVGICDQSAQSLVLSMNLAMVKCERSGMEVESGPRELDQATLAALFGSFVPEGVVNGWLTGAWDDRTSFNCD